MLAMFQDYRRVAERSSNIRQLTVMLTPKSLAFLFSSSMAPNDAISRSKASCSIFHFARLLFGCEYDKLDIS